MLQHCDECDQDFILNPQGITGIQAQVAMRAPAWLCGPCGEDQDPRAPWEGAKRKFQRRGRVFVETNNAFMAFPPDCVGNRPDPR